jgi:prepilin-type processing-associated H-X9-DG protein
MQCTNNLKQIALALHNYHDVNKQFPYENTDVNDTVRCNWAAHIFPYIELPFTPKATGPTFTYTPGATVPNPGIRNDAIDETFVVKTYICPSDGQTLSGDRKYALTNYLAVNAPNTDQHDYWNTSTAGIFVYQCHNTVNVGIADPHANVRATGPPTTIATITDGTSNTLAVGERPPLPSTGNDSGQGTGFCGAWAYVEIDSALGLPNTRQWCATADEQQKPCPSGPQWFQPPQGGGSLCDGNHFWSRHPGGGNWAFADGSVHFLAYNIGTAVQAALATKAGGEVIPGDAF